MVPIGVGLRIKLHEMSKEKQYLSGYALLWNVPYVYTSREGSFIETIAPGALDNADMSDVVALFNHSPNLVLGRNTSGTLNLKTDKTGLYFRVQVPNTSSGEEAAVLVGRRDVTTCSWGFQMMMDRNGTMPGETWTKTERGTPIRTITSVTKVFDVSVTTWAANPKTSVFLEGGTTTSDIRSADSEAMARELDQAQMQMELTLARHNLEKSKFEYGQLKRNTPLRPEVIKQLNFFKKLYNLK